MCAVLNPILRDELNLHFELLQKGFPSLIEQRVSKSYILKKATKYIYELTAEVLRSHPLLGTPLSPLLGTPLSPLLGTPISPLLGTPLSPLLGLPRSSNV